MTISSPPAPASTRGKVLLVDDDPGLLQVYVRLIESAGHDVFTATDGLRALEHLRRLPFDAVVTDIGMPHMDGLGLLQAIQLEDQGMPVVLMTGAASLGSAEQAFEYGAFRYLQKPVELSRFASVVDQAVARGQRVRLERQVIARAQLEAETSETPAELRPRFDLAMGSLWMAYQPIVRWSTRSVFAYEALARTREPSLRNPLQQLEAAEILGESRPLSRAIRAIAPLPLVDSPALLFINLAARDLEDAALFATDTPLARMASRTVLEITERAALEGIHDVRGRIAHLRRLGYRIALDDMGAGYSGLTSLALLEPDVVKLDMTLVRGIEASMTKQRLVRAMTSLCESLGSIIVAEGVETQDERRALCDVGCDYLQGYLFARPGPPFPPTSFADLESSP